MAEDDDSKTEEPTGRRLDQAREEGDVVQSHEVKTAAMLTAIAILVWLILPSAMNKLRILLTAIVNEVGTLRVGSEGELMSVLRDLGGHVVLVMLIPLGFLMTVGLISSFAQIGWLVTFSKIAPDLGKISPLRGFGRIFSLNGVVDLVKSIAKLVLVAVLFGWVLRPQLRMLPLLPTMELPMILAMLHRLLVGLLFTVAAAEIVIAAADYMYQRHTMLKRLRMTKQEVKDEHRQTEGDPVVKSRLRNLRMQRARSRMMAAVAKADVVVTNPTHYACALKYDPETMNAPVLVAKGQDLVALRIREIAEQNGIDIVENPPLARALYAAVEIDREIPPEQYKAVAEVISYVFRLKGKLKR